MSTRAEWLSALAAFESAARHQNFAHAGEELHLTASAVSHHVRKLESRLGLPLFQRHARGVSLTAAGRQLADAASSSLADLEDVLRGLKASSGDHDLVRIATLHSFVTSWLMPRSVKTAFRGALPETPLTFLSETSSLRTPSILQHGTMVPNLWSVSFRSVTLPSSPRSSAERKLLGALSAERPSSLVLDRLRM